MVSLVFRVGHPGEWALSGDLVMGKEAFGTRLAGALGLDAGASIATKTRRSEIQVTRLASEEPMEERTRSLPGEDAYILGIQLIDCLERALWLDDHPVEAAPLKAGTFVAYDLRRLPSWRTASPFDAITLHLPREALDALTDGAGLPRLGEMTCADGVGTDDAILRDLGSLLLPALSAPHEASQLFLDNVIIALCAHVSQTYGGAGPCQRLYRGGLASWQERKAKEMLNANLVGAIRISDLADECGLSTSQFSRSFRQSTGLAPHQWLLNRRVEVAKDLLSGNPMALSEVSLACGFADQSHFTRVFSRVVGISPGAWRRSYL